MAQFCQQSSEGKLVPIEMEKIGIGMRSDIYRCPTCSANREAIGLRGGGSEVRSVTPKHANRQIKKSNIAMALLTAGGTALAEYLNIKMEMADWPG